jgi:DNA-binding LacI/PurR family transcriptional regulator
VLEAIEALGYAPNISAGGWCSANRTPSASCCMSRVHQSAVLSKIMENGYEQDYDILTQTIFPLSRQIEE